MQSIREDFPIKKNSIMVLFERFHQNCEIIRLLNKSEQFVNTIRIGGSRLGFKSIEAHEKTARKRGFPPCYAVSYIVKFNCLYFNITVKVMNCEHQKLEYIRYTRTEEGTMNKSILNAHSNSTMKWNAM